MIRRPAKLSTLVKQLRALGVLEYEEHADGLRLVFDEHGPAPVASSQPKKKQLGVTHIDPHRAARVALHGFTNPVDPSQAG